MKHQNFPCWRHSRARAIRFSYGGATSGREVCCQRRDYAITLQILGPITDHGDAEAQAVVGLSSRRDQWRRRRAHQQRRSNAGLAARPALPLRFLAEWHNQVRRPRNRLMGPNSAGNARGAVEDAGRDPRRSCGNVWRAFVALSRHRGGRGMARL